MTAVPPAVQPGTVEVREIRRLEEAKRVAPEWSGLMDRAIDPEPFFTPEWNLAWWDAFGEGEMRLLVARTSSRPVGVAPFRIQRQELWGAERRVLSYWSNPYSNRAQVVLDRDLARETASSLVRHMMDEMEGWDVARLGPMPAESQATRVLSSALSEFGARWGMRDSHSSPYIELPDSWDELAAGLDGKFRRNVRRKVRRAENETDLSYQFGGQSVRDVDAAFDISKDTWQHEQGTGITSTAAIERFYRTLASKASDRGWLRVAYLLADGQAVSYELSLEYDNRHYNLKIGYRQQRRSLSPGRVLKQAVLRRAISRGLDEYDFLGTAESFKMRWTDLVRPVGTLWVMRRGIVPLGVHTGWFRLRPIVVRWTPWLLDLKRKLVDRV